MLNQAQRNYLEGYFIGRYGVLTLIKDEVSAKEALIAFECLLEMQDEKYDKYEVNKDNFETQGILDFINQIKEIIKHDTPENRSSNYFEGETDWDYVIYKDENDNPIQEKKGILSLTAKNDKTTSAVTKTDVMSYLYAVLQNEINLLQKQVEIDELKAQFEQMKKSLNISSSIPSSTVPENPAAENNNNAIITEESVTCTVTGQIFHTPVSLTGSGRTVEEDAAKEILSTTKKCPFTKNKITGYEINWSMKDMVEIYMKANPNAVTYQPGELVVQATTVSVAPSPTPTVVNPVSAVRQPNIQASTIPDSQLGQSRYSVFNTNRANQNPTQFTLPSIAIVITSQTLKAYGEDPNKAECDITLLGDSSTNKYLFSSYVKEDAEHHFTLSYRSEFTFYEENNVRYLLWDSPSSNLNSIYMKYFLEKKNAYLHFGTAQSVSTDMQVILNKLAGVQGVDIYQINCSNNNVTLTKINSISQHLQNSITITDKNIYTQLSRSILQKLTDLLPKPATYVQPKPNTQTEKSSKASKCKVQ